MAKRSVVGWKLDPDERKALLGRFPALFPDIVADHVTLQAGTDDTPLPTEQSGEIVGETDDGAGVQALVVAIGGTTRRPDGGVWHISWSLDKAAGREAKESNEVIARLGWQPLAHAVPLRLIPARF